MAHTFEATTPIDVARSIVPSTTAPKAAATPRARADRPVTLAELKACSRVRAWIPQRLMDEFLSA